MTRYLTILSIAALALSVAGCQPAAEPEPEEAATEQPDHGTEPSATEETPAEGAPSNSATAVAELLPADPASGISGTVRFTQEAGGVRVEAEVSGLSPGQHGFHVHENGVCTAPFESAGDHLNPYDLDHGCPPADTRHLGDLGNLEVGADGTGTFDEVIDKISLVDPAHQIIGKAAILHSGEDDCESQPTGDSGDRIACGVIEGSP